LLSGEACLIDYLSNGAVADYNQHKLSFGGIGAPERVQPHGSISNNKPERWSLAGRSRAALTTSLAVTAALLTRL
jgi:hypothetical protein